MDEPPPPLFLNRRCEQMHRFYLPPNQDAGTSLRLSGREAHHALHVLRVRRGERVVVLNGQGLVCECQVKESGRDELLLEVLNQHQAPPLPCQVTLAQAVPKGKLFESILQKATELGVTRIVPLLTERTVVRPSEPEDSGKLEKWRLVTIEAIKQCGSAWLPQVEPPMTVAALVSKIRSAELALVGSLRGDAGHPRVYFDEFRLRHGRKPETVSIAIGPEGDFTDAELSALQVAGALPITLGPLVLRTETAAVYCLAIVNYELQSGKQPSAN